MSEHSQPIYNDFIEYVKRMKAELASVDAKSPSGDDTDECAKYVEKLNIYQRYTDDLINNGFQYLNVIEHLKTELAANDVPSVASSSSVCEETVRADIDFIRKCLESRSGMEEKAFDSLVQVQRVVDTLLNDYCGLVQKNKHLAEQLKNGRKVPSSCGHAKQIALLQQENDSLKNKIDSISKASNRRCTSFDTDCNNSKRLNDCEAEIELLKQQLAKKDKTIEKLLFRSRNQSSSWMSSSRNCGSMESTSIDTIGSNAPTHKNYLHRTRSDGCYTPNKSCVCNNLSVLEERDTAKVRALQKGYKELTMILKEKYAQLRKQRAKIDQLMNQLENVADLKCAMEQLQKEKEHLENQVKNMPNHADALDKMQRQIAKCNVELERLRKREQFLARKVVSQDELVKALSAERENLVKINDKMKRSICLCQKELCKYCK